LNFENDLVSHIKQNIEQNNGIIAYQKPQYLIEEERIKHMPIIKPQQ
jgi:hypothetical protein